MSAAWWRAYRQRRRETGNTVKRRQDYVRLDRPLLGKPRRVRFAQPTGPVPILFPEIDRTQTAAPLTLSLTSSWFRELRMDLAQECELAILEGRDPKVAVREYRSREYDFYNRTVPIFDYEADSGVL